MKVDIELEAEFDAQAFAKGGKHALRAIIAHIKDGKVCLTSTVPWNDEITVQEAFQGIIPMLSDDQACYVLFRTATWALFTWAPATDCEHRAYADASLGLRNAFGPSLIPNVCIWHSMADVKLDDKVVHAPALSY